MLYLRTWKHSSAGMSARLTSGRPRVRAPLLPFSIESRKLKDFPVKLKVCGFLFRLALIKKGITPSSVAMWQLFKANQKSGYLSHHKYIQGHQYQNVYWFDFFSFSRSYTITDFTCGFTIQYSLTPAVRYLNSFIP